MKTFQERLRAAQQNGNLSVKDLSIWFARPYPTVRCWVMGSGNQPWGPFQEEAFRRLENLERFVRHNKVRYDMSQRERAYWWKQVAHDFNGKISKTRSTA